MDIVDKIKNEINELKLVNKLQIARYIYRRIGQLFQYDPSWFFVTNEEREKLKNDTIDIHNVKEKNINNFSWSTMYVEILKEFGIEAKVEYEQGKIYNADLGAYYMKNVNSYVDINIDGTTYKAALTKNLNDLIAVKFGLNTKYNCETSNEPKPQTKEELRIARLKETLEAIKKDQKFKEDEYTYQVFRCIENSANLSKFNVGYVEGKSYIESLARELISDDFEPFNICFYDVEGERYISTYIVSVNNTNVFFSCEKQLSGLYGFVEIPKERMDFYFQNLDYVLSDNLKKIIKNQEKKPVASVQF